MPTASCLTSDHTRAGIASGDCALPGHHGAARFAGLPWSWMSRRTTSNQVVFFAAALLAGCASGIERAEEACMNYRTTVAGYAACLRSNFATLTSGPQNERDIDAAYLAAAEYQTAAVATGRKTDQEAMLELAALNVSVFAPEIQKRREAAFQSVMQSMQNSGNSGDGTGRNQAQQSSRPYGRGGTNYGSGQSGYNGQRSANYGTQQRRYNLQ